MIVTYRYNISLTKRWKVTFNLAKLIRWSTTKKRILGSVTKKSSNNSRGHKSYAGSKKENRRRRGKAKKKKIKLHRCCQILTWTRCLIWNTSSWMWSRAKTSTFTSRTLWTTQHKWMRHKCAKSSLKRILQASWTRLIKLHRLAVAALVSLKTVWALRVRKSPPNQRRSAICRRFALNAAADTTVASIECRSRSGKSEYSTYGSVSGWSCGTEVCWCA